MACGIVKLEARKVCLVVKVCQPQEIRPAIGGRLGKRVAANLAIKPERDPG